MGHTQSCGLPELPLGAWAGVCRLGPADSNSDKTGAAMSSKQARRFMSRAFKAIESYSYHREVTSQNRGWMGHTTERNGV
jgi:hypothetical protein